MKVCVSKYRISYEDENMNIRRAEMEFSESLKKNRDFKVVYDQGRSCANRYLVMYTLNNDKSGNRLGISVSKKVGNSVVRHRLTRLIRESYRLNEGYFSKGLDIVVIARVYAKEASFKDIERSLLKLAAQHHIVNQGQL